MKVLEIVHGFPPAARGGAEIYAHAHARALREHFGDEIVVFTREQDPNRAEYDVRTEDRNGLRLVQVNNTFRSIRSFEETYRNEAIGAIAGRVIDRFGPDVAHIHHLTCLSTTIVRSLAERRIPCFVTLHDYWLMCHRGQLLDVHYNVCDGPGRDDPGGCHACLGVAGGAGSVGFLGARILRAVEQRLPEAPARQLRGAVGRLAGLASRPSETDEQARRRFEHMREVCDEVTHFLAPSRYMRDRFVQFGVKPERITVAGNGLAPIRLPPSRAKRASAFAEATADRRSLGGGWSASLAETFGKGGKPDPERRDPRPSGGLLRLGFLGSLMVSKAPHVLLEAAGRLGGKVLVHLFGAYTAYHGDDSYRERLAPLLKQDGVHVHGAIAHDRVAEALSSIDVLVVPSIWPENSPLVIQEAFLAGVPVVASRIGGIPEAVADGLNGLLFNAGDPEDLSRTIARLLHETGLLDRLRAGIPPVRSIEEDVRFARSLYQVQQQAQSSQSKGFSANRAAGGKRIGAIVLNYRTPDETLLAVKSLLASRRSIDDIIVINNDSEDEARDALRDVWSKITYVHTGGNLGFSGGMNVGIREALARGADRVLLVNSDVIVPPDAVEHLDHGLDASPHAGIAGPVILARSEPDRIASLGMSYVLSTGRMRHWGHGRRVTAPESPGGIVDGVSGCLMMVKHEVFEAVGLLEEDYFFSFEDLDFCLKARRAGFTTVLAGRATAYHEGSRSLGATSTRRFYFATRNHLLLARRADPSAGRVVSCCRGGAIVMLNLVHAVISPGGSWPARVRAVARGARDYGAGRFGDGR